MTLNLFLLRVESFPRDAASLVDASLVPLHSVASTVLVLDGIRQAECEDDADQLKKQKRITRADYIARELSSRRFLYFFSFLFSLRFLLWSRGWKKPFLLDYILTSLYKFLPQPRRYPERLHPVHFPYT